LAGRRGTQVMPNSNVMQLVRSLICIATFGSLATACTLSETPSSLISRQFVQSAGVSIDLATIVTGTWEKVCVLGPYSNSDTAKEVLGFEWDAEGKTTIQSNDGISLLLFVQKSKVIAHVEHPRSHGDFSNLTMQCYLKEKAKFAHDPKPSKGWPGLFPKNAG
jgi:hypothetical protein